MSRSFSASRHRMCGLHAIPTPSKVVSLQHKYTIGCKGAWILSASRLLHTLCAHSHWWENCHMVLLHAQGWSPCVALTVHPLRCSAASGGGRLLFHAVLEAETSRAASCTAKPVLNAALISQLPSQGSPTITFSQLFSTSFVAKSSSAEKKMKLFIVPWLSFNLAGGPSQADFITIAFVVALPAFEKAPTQHLQFCSCYTHTSAISAVSIRATLSKGALACLLRFLYVNHPLHDGVRLTTATAYCSCIFILGKQFKSARGIYSAFWDTLSSPSLLCMKSRKQLQHCTRPSFITELCWSLGLKDLRFCLISMVLWLLLTDTPEPHLLPLMLFTTVASPLSSLYPISYHPMLVILDTASSIPTFQGMCCHSKTLFLCTALC